MAKKKTRSRGKTTDQQIPTYYYGSALISVLLIAVIHFSFSSSLSSQSDEDEVGFMKRKTDLPVLDAWFPGQSLDAAWEVRPLMSTVYADMKTGYQRKDTIDIVQNEENLGYMQQTIPSLFNIQNIDKVVSDPRIDFQKDVKMVKKIWKDNAEWTAIKPIEKNNPNVPVIDQLMTAFQNEDFSMIINDLEKRWGSVAKMAHSLYHELLPNYVSCNLYLTPPATGTEDGTSSGFETHWDWMDVFVVQISGQKLWTVAKQPKIFMSTPHMNRILSRKEVQQFVFQEEAYSDILLRPGDILYIPRGYPHNASTIGLDYKLQSEYLLEPQEHADPEILQRHHENLLKQPSLHLTFGIEYGCSLTYEALFHHMLHNFLQTLPPSSPVKQMIPITFPVSDCKSSIIDDYVRKDESIQQKGIQVSWEAMLHGMIARIARGSACQSMDDMKDECILRKSVPLSKAIQEISKVQVSMNEKNGFCDSTNNDKVNFGDSYSDTVDINFQKSLRSLQRSSPSISSILRFVVSLQKAENGSEFELPVKSFQQVQIHSLFVCGFGNVMGEIKVFRKSVENEDFFESIWDEFMTYASSKGNKVYNDALKEMKNDQRLNEKRRFQGNKMLLDSVGQIFEWESSDL